MLLAFIGDIHGNLPALDAALADARRRGARRIYCAGDLVGYGPFPAQVVTRIREEGLITIQGNYDLKVLEAAAHPKALKQKMKRRKWKILNWTRKRLDKAARRFLAALPETHEEELAPGVRLLLTHGSPRSPSDTIYPSITTVGLAAKAGPEPPAVLVCAHTHIPFARRVSGCLVVNCGSVGQPVDGDPRGAYALLRLTPDARPRARIVRFSYPLQETLRALADSSLPRYLRRDLKRGLKSRPTP